MDLLRKFNLQYLFAPEDAPTGGGGKLPSLSIDDMVDQLGDDNDEDPLKLDDEDEPADDDKDGDGPKGKSKSKGKDDKEDKEDSEDDEDKEDEDKEPEEEDLELTTPVRRKEILAKYPKLFKDFPQLEKAWFREQQFTEIIGTIDDAKEFKSKSETLDNLENDLMGGNTELILKAIKENNPKAFAKVADNYMGTLQKIDADAYNVVVGNMYKYAIIEMSKEARASQNSSLQEAATILHQFIFGKSEWKDPVRLSKDDPASDERESAQTKREREFEENRLSTVTEDLTSRVNNAVKNTIEANIDPKDSMSAYVKRNAVRDACAEVDKLIEKDSRLSRVNEKLWKEAKANNYSKPYLDKIKAANLSVVKTLLPSVIKKARNEALRGMGKKEENNTFRGRQGKTSNDDKPQSRNSGGKITKASDIPKGMTSLEFLMSED